MTMRAPAKRNIQSVKWLCKQLMVLFVDAAHPLLMANNKTVGVTIEGKYKRTRAEMYSFHFYDTRTSIKSS